MLDKARAHHKRKTPQPHAEELPLWDAKPAVDFFRSITRRLPELRERLEPYLSKGKEKLGDAYSSVAKVLAAQKEAFEDRLAEKRDRARTAPPKKRRTPSGRRTRNGKM